MKKNSESLNTVKSILNHVELLKHKKFVRLKKITKIDLKFERTCGTLALLRSILLIIGIIVTPALNANQKLATACACTPCKSASVYVAEILQTCKAFKLKSTLYPG